MKHLTYEHGNTTAPTQILCSLQSPYGTKCVGRIVTKSMSYFLHLQSAILCHPGSLELVCSWRTPQCESPQVTSLAKSKYHFSLRQLILINFKRSLLLNRYRLRPNSKTGSSASVSAIINFGLILWEKTSDGAYLFLVRATKKIKTVLNRKMPPKNYRSGKC